MARVRLKENLVERSGWGLAIDFGTSNTAAAIIDPHGAIRELRLTSSSTLMPSAVLFTADEVRVGDVAVRSALQEPSGFEPAPKRRMHEGQVFLGGRLLTPVDLITPVLADVLAKARRVIGGDPNWLVLTHPEHWSSPAKELLAAAARSAGVPGRYVRLLGEPQAAAWFYRQHGATAPDGRVAVFDFGAGTCDVAVLDCGPSGYRVIAAAGEDGLGGDTLDARLSGWVRGQLARRNPALAAELDDPRSIRLRLTLADQIRGAKEALSDSVTAAIVVLGRAGEQVLTISRSDFESVIAPDIDRAVALTRHVLDLVGGHRPILYLTGGSSHVPLIRNRLAQLAPLAEFADPKTVVAQGALTAPAHAFVDNRQRKRTPEPSRRTADENSAVPSGSFENRIDRLARLPRDLVVRLAALGGAYFFLLLAPLGLALLESELATSWTWWTSKVLVAVGGSAGALGGGAIADGFGRRSAILWGTTIAVVGYVAWSIAAAVQSNGGDGFPTGSTGQLILGALCAVATVGSGMAAIGLILLTVECTPRAVRGRTVLAIIAAGFAGIVVSSIALAEQISITTTGIVVAVSAVAVAVLVAFTIRGLEESPLWLHVRGQSDAADAIVGRWERITPRRDTEPVPRYRYVERTPWSKVALYAATLLIADSILLLTATELDGPTQSEWAASLTIGGVILTGAWFFIDRLAPEGLWLVVFAVQAVVVVLAPEAALFSVALLAALQRLSVALLFTAIPRTFAVRGRGRCFGVADAVTWTAFFIAYFVGTATVPAIPVAVSAAIAAGAAGVVLVRAGSPRSPERSPSGFGR